MIDDAEVFLRVAISQDLDGPWCDRGDHVAVSSWPYIGRIRQRGRHFLSRRI